ncbi:putative ribonuclease H-like domain-containing protein [Tanacetum coccineum]
MSSIKFILLAQLSTAKNPKSSDDDGFKPSSDVEKKVNEDPRKESECNDQEKEDNVNNTNNVNTVSSTVNAAGINEDNAELPVDPNMPALEDYSIFDLSSDDQEDGAEADMNNLDTIIQVSPIPTTRIHKDHPLNQEEPKKVIHALKDPSWIEAMQEELLQFKLVVQGYTQEEGIDYDEVFALVARIEAIRLFLDYSSFKDFVVYQMDVKIYVDDIIFGSTKKELCIAFEKLMHDKFQMSSMGELTFFLGLQVKQKKDGIFISQDKYVGEILKKFGFTKVKTTSTPMETQNPLLKDEDGEEVDIYIYRSMIGSLMYLTSLRPDIMYLKGQPKLGLWYSKDSPFDLVAYTDSDYGGASLDRKSTTGCCKFLRCRLISWQCKKHTVVANSTTEAEYVAASSCCGQVLWIQNQLLDYS